MTRRLLDSGYPDWKVTAVLGMVAWAVAGCGEAPLGDTLGEVPEIQLEEIVRFGSIDGPEEEQFTSIGSIEVDPETGEVFVLDPAALEIRVFARDGTFLRRFGGEGQGPGEFERRAVMTLARDTVVAFDEARRLHLFTPQGEHLQTRVADGVGTYVAAMDVFADSAGWILSMWEFPVGSREQPIPERYYRLILPEMSTEGPVFEFTTTGVSGMGVLDQRIWATHTGAGLVATTGADYELSYLRTGEDEARILRFEHVPVPVTPTVLDDFRAAQLAECDASRDPARCRSVNQEWIDERSALPVPDFRPVIGGLYGSSEGLVLVIRADLDPTPFDPSDSTRLDLVDLSGNRLGTLEMPARFYPRWFDAREIWGYFLDDFDVPHVVGYRMVR